MPTQLATNSFAGWLRTTAGASDWTMRPSCITTTRSANRSASAASWVTRTAAIPASHMVRSRSSVIAWRVGASSPAKGSSRRTTSGSTTSARARHTRRASPPESSRAGRAASAPIRKRSRYRATRRRDSSRAVARSFRPAATFASTVVSKRRLSWRIIAIRRRRSTIRPSASSSSPRKRARPAARGTSPISAWRRVVLPEPFGPITATTSPAPSRNEGTSRTRRPPRSTRTPCSSRRGGRALIVAARAAGRW